MRRTAAWTPLGGPRPACRLLQDATGACLAATSTKSHGAERHRAAISRLSALHVLIRPQTTIQRKVRFAVTGSGAGARRVADADCACLMLNARSATSPGRILACSANRSLQGCPGQARTRAMGEFEVPSRNRAVRIPYPGLTACHARGLGLQLETAVAARNLRRFGFLTSCTGVTAWSRFFMHWRKTLRQ